MLKQGLGRDLQTLGEKSPVWNRFPKRTYDPVEDPGWNSLCLKDCTLWQSDPHAAVCGELLFLRWTHTGEDSGGLSPIGRIPSWSNGGILSLSRSRNSP